MRYEDERREASSTTKLTYLLIGGGIGAVLGLLFAPKAGEELRGDIADATRKGIEKGKDAAVLVGEKAGDYYEVTRDKAGELYQTAQDKAGDLAGRAGELAEKAKGAVSGSNPLTDALEAGKQAYSDEKKRTDLKPFSEARPTYPTEKAEKRELNAPKQTAAKKDDE